MTPPDWVPPLYPPLPIGLHGWLATAEAGLGPDTGMGLLRPAIAPSVVPLPLMMVTVGGIFLGTLAISRFSLKIGVPAILGVLLFGLLINPSVTLFSQDTILRLQALSLSILLFNAGLETDIRSIRGFLEYGIILAVGGVILSSLLLGVIIWAVASPDAGGIELGFQQMPLAVAMLIAACLGSTDAGATMNVLQSLQKAIPPKLAALVQFESAVNDPTGILFLGLVIGLTSVDGGSSGHAVVLEQLQTFLQKIGSGLLIGVCVSYIGRFSLNRLVRDPSQLLILGISIGLISYGLAELLGGSGFISAYVAGLVLSNLPYRNERITPQALQRTLLPFNTMTEITVFLIFGLSVHPRALLPSVPEGIIVAIAMMLVARPVSVLVLQRFSPFSLRESLLVSWCGLRGAVPLALSFVMVEAIPRVRGLDPASVPSLVRNAGGIVFCVVVINLLVQGLTLPRVIRWLGLGEAAPSAP
ncbi:NhaP-type Na+(K+)/H+ antiporter [Cyanobium sp. Copco_Reservoir_LC18]|uniref:cation:proton antiporter domain-containing protein n=1 Tax=Cyanobium sp. Copco_Reservoir_LC18 TaxID=1328305 RepID=UPI001356AE3A|nr:cation:proton antiporter [Cyanobium sp. Copco_Reservoir_LC18]KAF0653963.1 NhaP-type Na+(K+)/H+ antiporter [Cyanobium sp. Copco_Reservoir_LC18]